MDGILDVLHSDLGQSIVNGISGDTGNDEAKTGDALSMALPVLMKAMERNASTPQGASDLMEAISNKHDGSILDNLGDFFGGGVDEDIKVDGAKILNHVLGDKQQGVAQIIGQKSGLDAGSVSNILKVAAPILMGMMGKEARQNNIDSEKGIASLLGGMLGNNTDANQQNFLEQVLDADGDGSVIDDVADLFLKSDNKKGGIGDMLGNLLG
jgi:hypothetical protein